MKIIIIGGGFAGLKLAQGLNNQERFEVLLIDKLTFHQFQPLFYQVATAGLEATNISFPFRKVFHNSKNVRIRITEVLEVCHADGYILTDIGRFDYDKLVLATGTTTNFFGNDKIKALALPMKSTLEALQLMNKVINNFEDALDLKADYEKRAMMSIVIVGGGPTGAELAGALAEMKKNILPKDYPDLNINLMNIYLIDHGKRPLSAMSEKSGKDAHRYLSNLGVTLMFECGVKDYDGKRLLLENDEELFVNTVIWAAGVRGVIPEGIPSELIAKGNRVKVDRFCAVPGFPDLYAIGDIAFMETATYPTGHPQLASVAGSQGKYLAKNFIDRSKGRNLKEYQFVDRGVMATIGKRMAVVDLPKPKLHLNGRLAWFIWMFLHLFLILGIKNRIQIFINWVYKYFTADQSLRLAQRQTGKLKNITVATKLPD